MNNKRIHKFLLLLASVPAYVIIALTCQSCGIYSFSGTSIQPDVKTINIDYFEYKALTVNPNLAAQLTEEMRERFRKMTKLEQVDDEGDLEIYGEVTGYAVSTAGVNAQEQASMNRLTVSVKIKFTNRKYPEDSFEKSFSSFAEFDASQLLDSVQDALCEEIVEKLVEDVFTATVAQW